MTVNEQVPDGWLFMTAEFGTDDKYVQLVRNEEQCRLWLRVWDYCDSDHQATDHDDPPMLYVRGYGQTFEEALADACAKAVEEGVLTESMVQDNE